MSSRERSKLTSLQTVYHPMSNQDAIWLKDDAEVEALLRQSDFYMIAARQEAKFLDFSYDPDLRQISFTYAIGESFRDNVVLDMPELPGIAADPGEDLWVEMGEKIVRAWDRPQEEPGAKVLEWFTTEKTDLGPRTTTTRGERIRPLPRSFRL